MTGGFEKNQMARKKKMAEEEKKRKAEAKQKFEANMENLWEVGLWKL